MQTRFSRLRRTFWGFGAITGAVVSAALTLLVIAWEWLENPGGIFRDENATNWPAVLETAISWLLPTFAVVATIAAIAHLAWSAARR